jgi:hypothetical protein
MAFSKITEKEERKRKICSAVLWFMAIWVMGMAMAAIRYQLAIIYSSTFNLLWLCVRDGKWKIYFVNVLCSFIHSASLLFVSSFCGIGLLNVIGWGFEYTLIYTLIDYCFCCSCRVVKQIDRSRQ